MIGVHFLALLAIGALAQQLDTLEKLLAEISQPLQRDLFAASLIFPRTASLRDSKEPVSSYEIDKLNFNEVISLVQKDIHLIATSFRKVPLLLISSYDY